MGFDVETFRSLLEGPGGFGERWNSTPIPRNDVQQIGEPCLGQRSLDGAGALGLVLHYLGSAMVELLLQQIFVLTPTTLSCYLDFAQDVLYNTLCAMPDARISFPHSCEHFEYLSGLICACHPLLNGAFGLIDGLSFAAQESDDPEIENTTYNGWKSDHRINNVLAFSPEGPLSISCN